MLPAAIGKCSKRLDPCRGLVTCWHQECEQHTQDTQSTWKCIQKKHKALVNVMKILITTHVFLLRLFERTFTSIKIKSCKHFWVPSNLEISKTYFVHSNYEKFEMVIFIVNKHTQTNWWTRKKRFDTMTKGYVNPNDAAQTHQLFKSKKKNNVNNTHAWCTITWKWIHNCNYIFLKKEGS